MFSDAALRDSSEKGDQRPLCRTSWCSSTLPSRERFPTDRGSADVLSDVLRRRQTRCAAGVLGAREVELHHAGESVATRRAARSRKTMMMRSRLRLWEPVLSSLQLFAEPRGDQRLAQRSKFAAHRFELHGLRQRKRAKASRVSLRAATSSVG